MKIAIGSDHRGLELKQKVIKLVTDAGNEYKDFGAYSEARVDYPNIAEAVGKAVVSGQYDRGILICGTGIGMCIAANKVKGIRAGLAVNEFMALRSRQHNDANILCLGARIISWETAAEIVTTFLTTPFSGGERHMCRIQKIHSLTGL